MAIVIRKNGKANNALAGLERGLNNGMELGLQAARQRGYMEEVRRRAMMADQEIQRERAEKQQRQATEGEAAGAMAQEIDPQTSLEQFKARIAPIAERLGRDSGLHTAKAFLDDAFGQYKKRINDNDLEDIRDEQAREVSEGSWKMPVEEGSLLTPEEVGEGQATLDSGLEQINAMLAAPDADAVEIRKARAKLKEGIATSRGKADGRKQMIEKYRGRIGEVEDGHPEQLDMLNTLVHAYEMNPKAYDDRQYATAFDKKFNDALEGYTTVQGERIRIEDVEVFEKLKRENMRLQNEALKARKLEYESQANENNSRAKAIGDGRSSSGAAAKSDAPTALDKSKMVAAALDYREKASMLGEGDPQKAALEQIASELEAEARGGIAPAAGQPAPPTLPAGPKALGDKPTKEAAKKLMEEAAARGAGPDELKALAEKLTKEIQGG